MPSIPPVEVPRRLGTIQGTLEAHGKPGTLTVCMIVKNEKDNIRDAVESFRPFADEIVVNDTGSTDGTLEILRELGVVLVQSEWIGNFAHARNISLKPATSRWILWMDADDRVPADQVENFRKLKTAPLDRIFGFRVINTQAGIAVGTQFYQTRMFPNHPGICFERKVHEQMIYSAAVLGLHSMFTETTIHHTGYEDPETKLEKARRNLELMAGHEDRDVDPVIAMQEGDSLSIVGEWEKAALAYVHAMQVPHAEEINRDAYVELPNSIGRCYQHLKRWDEALDWFAKGRCLAPDKPEPVYYSAEILLRCGRKDEALPLFQQVLEMDAVASSTGSQHNVIRMYSYKNLCELNTARGNHEKVLELAEKFHEDYPEVIEPIFYRGRSLLSLGRAKEAVVVLEDGLERWPQADVSNWHALEMAYEKLGKTDLASRSREGMLAAGHGVASEAFSAPDLSICLIVKNEEKNLPDCLNSIRGLWDDLVVVDTGSTDRSCEIAESFGARVEFFPWIQDFSAARNHSLAAARGRWIFWLDADDRILPDDLQRIRALAKEPADRAHGFLVKNSTDGGATGSVFNQLRMFPNRPEIRFTGRVHEQVLSAVTGAGLEVQFHGIHVIHAGYLDDATVAAKQERNLAILLEELEKHPDETTAVRLYSLGGALLDLKRYDEAMSWYRKAMERSVRVGEDLHIRDSISVKIAVCQAEKKNYDVALQVLEQAFGDSPCDAEAVLVRAQIFEKTGQTENAAREYARLFQFQEELSFMPVDTADFKIKAASYLGDYWEKKGQRSLAVELLRIGLEIKKGLVIASDKLASLYFDQECYAACLDYLKFGNALEENAENWMNQGKVYIMLKEAKPALEALEKSMLLEPKNEETQGLLDLLRRDQKC